MMIPLRGSIYDQQYCRDQATELRRLAAEENDETIKNYLLTLADDYAELAEAATAK